nr:heat shock protein 67B2-like [Leptinotarsa decemlineata]
MSESRNLLSLIYRGVRNSLFSSDHKIMEATRKSIHHSTLPKDVSYEDVKKVSLENCEALIIDVREPDELKETGVLPGSINIPLGQLESVLKDVSNEHFYATYGKEKPTQNFPIIFSCRSGKRSASAQAIAQQLGFKRVHNYAGGWLDWEEKSKS